MGGYGVWGWGVSLSTPSTTGSKPSLTPGPHCQAQDLQTGGPGSVAEGARPPGSWVCRDNLAGRGGDETWGPEALGTVREEVRVGLGAGPGQRAEALR